MKNAAISVLSEICELELRELFKDLQFETQLSEDGIRTRLLHLKESSLTVQNEELLTETKVVLEEMALGKESKSGDIYVMQ